MAHLAYLYAESYVSCKILRSHLKLKSSFAHGRRYAEDLFRIKDLQVLKKATIRPLHMLVRRGYNSLPGDSTHEP